MTCAGHRAGPAVVRPGPRPARRPHRSRRGAGYRLGPARIPPSWFHPPRRGRGRPAHADGEVPAQEVGERTALLPPLGGGDRRGHQPARARRQQTLRS
ncbi:hypothetical protein SGPA1_22036 [Streptomyces misionensis JCM 4497]